MAKQLIRLTEGDLHRIIKESVQNILTEMDWRTYQSAYKTELDRNGNTEKAAKFRQAANNAFNRQNGYGLKNVPHGYQKDNKMTADGDFYGGGNLHRYDADAFQTNSGKMQKGREDADTVYSQQAINKKNGQQLPNDADVNGKSMNLLLKAKQMKGDKQVRDYFDGKTQYQRGKGWVNK